jgi:hypothetical protein
VLLLKSLSGRFSAVVAEFEVEANGFFDELGQPLHYLAWAPVPPFPKEIA